MYRVLIADDEALEREGLEYILNRALPGMFEITMAANGRLAIQRAEQTRPHIVLMDIKMPGIEGLEAIRQMKEAQPDLLAVLVTAYDYFAYAQQAVALGVEAYLLKPARSEQIVTLMRRLVKELEERERLREEKLNREEKLSALMPLAVSELATLIMTDAELDTDFHQMAAMLELDVEWGYALSFVAEGEIDHRRLLHAVRNHALTQGSGFVSPMIGKHAAVFFVGSRMAQETPEAAEYKKAALLSFLEQQAGVPFRVANGGVRSGIEGLRQSYRESLAALGFGAGLPSREDPPWRNLSTKQEREQARFIIEKAKAWVEAHYRGEVTMEQAAEHVRLSPFYFSKLFKQQVGDTFIDYLTSLRIDRAKQLIAQDGLSLKEICYEVGYNDPNYFSRVFRKVTKMSPSEYRLFTQQKLQEF